MDLEIDKAKFDSLDEKDKEFYAADGDTGKYKIVPAQLVKRQSEFEGMKRNYDRLLDEVKTFKAKAKELEEKEAAAKKEAEEKEQELLAKKGDWESLKKSYEAKVLAEKENGDNKVKDYVNRIHRLVVENDITSMVAELAVAKAQPLLRAYLEKRVRARYLENGDVVPEYLDESGKPTAFTRSEFMNIIKGDPSCAPIIKASEATGGGHQGAGASQNQTTTPSVPSGGGGKKKMETEEEFLAKQEKKLQEFLKQTGG